MAADVLILGGGFAGLAAVRRLASAARGNEVNVRLIDRRDVSVFSPLLPDLISGRIFPDTVAFPIGPFCRRHGADFHRAEIAAIDPDTGEVLTSAGRFRGDRILLAVGCETNYFGQKAPQARAIGLKSIAEGRRIAAEAVPLILNATPDRPAELLVVGGGYTGFEAASHLALLAHGLTDLPYGELHRLVRITILDIADDVLRTVCPPLRRWARRLMNAFGVEIRTGTTVEAMDSGGWVRLTDGAERHGALTVWTPGVTPPPAATSFGPDTGSGQRLEVDPYLRVGGRETLFAAGDVAAAKGSDGQFLRMSVQFSLSGGRAAAHNILASLRDDSLKTFGPFDPGYVVPLAPGKGVGRILGREMAGRLPAVLHYFMCMARSWGMANRGKVLADLLTARSGWRRKRGSKRV